jgi:Right handed beta helix region
MRAFISAMTLCLAVATAHAVPLNLVRVDASALNRVFDTDGKITPHNFTEPFTLQHTTGSAFLQSQRLPPGEKGTRGEGLFAYLYRLDLSKLKGSNDAPCIHGLSIDFGPVEPLDYNGDERRDDGFIIADGGPGTLPPHSAERLGDTVIFHFSPVLCAARISSGDATFFFGLATKHAPTIVEVQLRDTYQIDTPLKTEAPKLPVHVNCDAGESLPEVFPPVPGGILRITGKCKGTFFVPKDIAEAALVGVEQTEISGEGKPGAVITIDGSRDVVIKNVTVRDGLDGIVTRSGASARFINVSAVENDDDGFEFVEASEVQCIDCLASRNGGDGFYILRSPLTNFLGHTVSALNNQNGIKLLEATAVFGEFHRHTPTDRPKMRAMTRQLQVDDTPCEGIEEEVGVIEIKDPNDLNDPNPYARYHCSGAINFNAQEGVLSIGGRLYIGPGCRVNANGNSSAGISLTWSSRVDIYKARVKALSNALSGFEVADSSLLCTDGSTVRVLTNGNDGIRVQDASNVYVDSKPRSSKDSAICSKNNTQIGLAVLGSTVSCAGSIPLILNPNGLADSTGLDVTSGCVVSAEQDCLTAAPSVVR